MDGRVRKEVQRETPCTTLDKRCIVSIHIAGGETALPDVQQETREVQKLHSSRYFWMKKL
ncbi:hypothetical protein DV515_00004168 [Chloebia gouldiae]|uniref:Uncharacterized protein n=1 Tax=Chloebia gouldiae TaxID=44316 RepID=A0A3L8SRN7_CHLGU|nr:hypothetical protein DV515_00004168 [Chloebia gouldiae]